MRFIRWISSVSYTHLDVYKRQTKSSVRISGDDKPAEVVRSQFLKLNSEHIRFVVGGLKENTTRIRNMRQYLLATL